MKSLFFSSFIATSLLIVACSSASGPSLDPAQSDCKSVCSKVHDCINQNSDEDKCTNNCTTKSDSDNVYQAKIKDCAACVEPRACSETSTCTSDCLKVLLP